MAQANVLTVGTTRFDALLDRTFLWSLFLYFNFMITFRVLLVSFIPSVELFLEAVYEFFLVFYLVYRLIRRIVIGNLSFNSLELYLSVFTLLPVLAMYASHREFGQPLFYGLAPYRDFYLMFGALLMYNLLRQGTITIQQVERVFIFTAWFNCTLFYLLTLLTNPADFKETGLAGANALKGGDVYYRFNMAFIFFGTIYYSIKAFYHKKLIYLVYALFFAFYVTYYRLDRTSIAVLFASLGLFYLTAVHLRRQVAFLLAAVIPGIVFIFVLIFFAPKLIDKYYVMFADAFATTQGDFNSDGQESIRIYQLNVAIAQIKKNPWIGNGKVSPQWVPGGYNYFFGYFYASDVGIFGQVFMYGFIGAALLYSQFFFALYHILKIRHIKQNILLNTCKYFLLALALDSITNGYLTIYAAQSITAMVIIYYFYQQDKLLQAKVREEKAKELMENFNGHGHTPALVTA